MAEIVEIASFDFDTDRLEASLERLQNQLFDIQKEQKRYREENSRLEKQYNELDKQQKEMVKRRDTESQQYKDLVAQMKNIREQQRGVFQQQKDLSIQQSKVNSEYAETVKLYKSMTTETGVYIGYQEKLNELLTKEIGTRAEAKKNNRELNALKDQLNVNVKEEAELLELINERVNANNELLKESGSQYEKQISNVGNYKQDIKEAFQELNIFNGGLSAFIVRANQAGGAGNLISGSLKQATTSLAGLTKQSLVFIATPLGAVLAVIAGAFLLVKNAMSQNEETANSLGRVFTTLGNVFSNFLKYLEPIGTFLADVLVKGFELAMASAQKAINFFADVSDALGFESAAKGLRAYNAELVEASNNANRLMNIQNELLKTQSSFNRETGRLTEEFKAQNKIAEDTSRSIADREKAVKASIVASEKLQKLETQRLELEKQRAMLEESNAIRRDIIASEYEKKINEINASALEAQTTQNNKLNIIRQQALDMEIKRQQELLSLFVAQQGFKARTLEEELKLSQEVAKKQEAILKKQLANDKISQIEYNTEMVKLKNDLLLQQAKIAQDQGKRELEEFIKTRQSMLREGELYTEESKAIDIKNLEEIREAHLEFQKQNFELGLINEREYQDNIQAIKDEYYQKDIEIRNKYLQQQREQDELQATLDFEAKLLRLEEENASEFEFQKMQQEMYYQQELLSLQERQAAGLISTENYNKALENLKKQNALAEKKIEFEKNQAILNMNAEVFGGIAKLLGERTSAGKAAAIAEAVMNTWAGVNQVWATPSIYPEPWATVQRGVSTGVVIKSGLESVKKITAVNTGSASSAGEQTIHGFDTGGVITDGIPINRDNGDNVLMTGRIGEVVLNEQQQRAIGLGALASAGVPGINSSSSSLVQDSIMSNFDMNVFADTIRTATMEGTAIGSEVGSTKGIKGMAQDRVIQQNASF